MIRWFCSSPCCSNRLNKHLFRAEFVPGMGVEQSQGISARLEETTKQSHSPGTKRPGTPAGNGEFWVRPVTGSGRVGTGATPGMARASQALGEEDAKQEGQGGCWVHAAMEEGAGGELVGGASGLGRGSGGHAEGSCWASGPQNPAPTSEVTCDLSERGQLTPCAGRMALCLFLHVFVLMYCILPWIMFTHIFWPKLSGAKKIFCFSFFIQFFLCI